MADLNGILSTPDQWADELGALAEERKKIEAREEKLKDRLKLHMKEKGLASVLGGKYEAKLGTTERLDFTQKSLGELYGEKWLAETVTKLNKNKSDTFKVVERKPEEPKKADPVADRKTQEIVDYFAGKPKEVAKQVSDGLAIGQIVDEVKRRKPFPKF